MRRGCRSITIAPPGLWAGDATLTSRCASSAELADIAVTDLVEIFGGNASTATTTGEVAGVIIDIILICIYILS
jgi:hypothetical protein